MITRRRFLAGVGGTAVLAAMPLGAVAKHNRRLGRYCVDVTDLSLRYDEFEKNPVFLWNHDWLSPPIGRVINLRELSWEGPATKTTLEFDVEFTTNRFRKHAQQVELGYVRDPHNGGRVARGQNAQGELVELSLCPCNGRCDMAYGWHPLQDYERR